MSALPLPQITLVAKSCDKYPFGLFRQAGARRYFEFNIPIERNGEILGYIWANELTEIFAARPGKWM